MRLFMAALAALVLAGCSDKPGAFERGWRAGVLHERTYGHKSYAVKIHLLGTYRDSLERHWSDTVRLDVKPRSFISPSRRIPSDRWTYWRSVTLEVVRPDTINIPAAP